MKSRNRLKSWRSLWTAGSTLLAEIITPVLTRLMESHGAVNSAARFKAGCELGLIPCRVRASAGRSETHRHHPRQYTHE